MKSLSRRPSRSCAFAQAQLVGWLEGLFQGIQLALARQGKRPPGGPPQPPAGSGPQQLPGQYM